MPISKINTTSITDNSVTAGKIVAGAVDADIAAGSIDTAQIADDAVTADKLANAINTSIAAKAPLASPVFTGNVSHGDNVKAKFGTGNDLEIFHDGSHSRIKDVGTGHLVLSGGEVHFNDSSNTSNHLAINADGIVTKPLQPAFMARAVGATNLAIQTWHTLAFGNERFDNNNDFSSNTFTAPVTGKYQMNVFIRFHSIDNSGHYYFLTLDTSNNTYYHIHGANGWSNDPDYHTIGSSYVADMDAGDTATVSFYQASGSAQTDVQANEGYFSGCLVA